jgi:hypothetical protein
VIEGQEFIVRTYSHTFYGSLTNKGSFSTDMSGCSFHLLTDAFFFAVLFIPKSHADRLANGGGPQFDKHSYRNGGKTRYCCVRDLDRFCCDQLCQPTGQSNAEQLHFTS